MPRIKTRREVLLDTAVRHSWSLFELQRAERRARHVGALSALKEQYVFVDQVRYTFRRMARDAKT